VSAFVCSGSDSISDRAMPEQQGPEAETLLDSRVWSPPLVMAGLRLGTPTCRTLIRFVPCIVNSEKNKTMLRFFVVLIPCINLFNYYLTYSNITFSARTALTFTIDTLQGYAVWLIVHFVIRYLDRVMPFAHNILRRLIVQLIITVVAGIFFLITSTMILHYATSDHPIPSSFFTYDLPIISVWFLVINGIYVGYYFFLQWDAAEKKRNEENKIRTGGIKVKSGKRDQLLSHAEIAGFVVEGDYAVCHTLQATKFVMDQSMDNIEKGLPALFFYRLNRQVLIHRQVVNGFERVENGKLNVMLRGTTTIPSPVKLSRTRAADFKKWLEPEP
jgi:hypothetical protein